jgi:hypothetical protein
MHFPSYFRQGNITNYVEGEFRPRLSFSVSVSEPCHFYTAPAPDKNFDAAMAPSLLYSKLTFKKQ